MLHYFSCRPQRLSWKYCIGKVHLTVYILRFTGQKIAASTSRAPTNPRLHLSVLCPTTSAAANKRSRASEGCYLSSVRPFCSSAGCTLGDFPSSRMALSGSALAITYGTVHRFLPRLLVPVYSTLNLHGTFHDRPFSVWKPSLYGSIPVGRLSMDHLRNPGRTCALLMLLCGSRG